MGIIWPLVALTLYSSPRKSAIVLQGWGFHTMPRGAAPGSHFVFAPATLELSMYGTVYVAIMK